MGDNFAIHFLGELYGSHHMQLISIFTDFLKRAGAKCSAEDLMEKIDSRIKSGETLVIVGHRMDSICALLVLDVYKDWFDSKFACVTCAWSNGKLNLEEKKRMDHMIKDGAKRLNLTRISWQTKRNPSAMEKWAKKFGYKPVATIFEMGV